ncbi:hypothetical protein QQS21_004389 [Conoideocrella luteorostrata]|uniref:Thioesterase family protein n=1 Tax=Conoideocrella luteorostrata TaxID=1105319 RepID=A0AAJ0CRH0_9HYPO|nr:hypothetical protein QQS21_004389 [Conoideocrella luteorostrata]
MANSKDLSFNDSIKVEKLDSHTYKANLSGLFCIGSVPNGGYTASCMLAAASTHLASRKQTDTFTTHLEYLNRTSPGPAVITIEDMKLGKQVSTLHLTLWQGDGLLQQAPWVTSGVTRRIMLAYTTQINLRTFTGISLPTGYESTVADTAPPQPNLNTLDKNGGDKTWEESKVPKSMIKIMSSLGNWRFFIPRKGPFQPGVMDLWLCLANGESITQATLPYVADSFPYNLHLFLVAPELRAMLEPPAPNKSEDSKATSHRAKTQKMNEDRAGMWFPTLVMNLENKAALPEEGVKWLNMRITSKQINNGKFDLDVIIRDTDGELVALSHHVAMVLSMARNTGKPSL